MWCFVCYRFLPYLWTNPQNFLSRMWRKQYYIWQWILLFSKLFSFMIFCMEVYMELQPDLSLLFTNDASMVSIDVHFQSTLWWRCGDLDVESEYYYRDLFKPSKASPFHVMFGLRGVLARQGKYFKPCTLILVEW